MQAQPPRHRPYDKPAWENRLCTSTLWVVWSAQPLLDGSADVLAGRLSLKEDCPDHPGLQGASCSPHAPGLEGLSPLPQKAWCGGCPAAGVYCAGWHAGLTHACIAHPLPCLHVHPWQGRPGRTPSVLSSCVLAAAPLRLRGGGVSASDGSGPRCLSCSISSGLSPAPLVSTADYNNHICIFFSLFCFCRGHNWYIIPASRHKRGTWFIVTHTLLFCDLLAH